MATKFSSIYKQELKSKGALQSMGSTVVKSMAERVDLRNILFGGKGFVAKTGRRIFGKGYDPIDRARRITPDSSTAVTAIASLQESNKRQEDALKIIVKNTMNMNMMARDMNITRQNIASMTKSITGKSSKGADALWMNAAKRDREDKSTAPTKIGGNSSSILSGVLGGVMGIGGSAGSMIFRALGSIVALSPIVGIVGIAAAGYAIKKMAEDIDFKGMFESVKNNIMKFLGIDPDSDEPILRQLASKLNAVFSTTRFTDIYDWVDKTFSEDFKRIRRMIKDGTDMIMSYSEAAFRVLGDNFAKVGEIFSFHFKNFINEYKPEMLATLGAAVGGSVGSLFGIKGAALGALIAGGAGYIIGKITKTRNLEDIKSDMEEAKQKIAGAELDIQNALKSYKIDEKTGKKIALGAVDRFIQQRAEKTIAEQTDILSSLENERSAAVAKVESMRITPGNFPGGSNFQQYLDEALQKQRSPQRVGAAEQEQMATLIYQKFRENGYTDLQARAAIANAIQESQLNPLAENTNGEESYGLFQINRKAHPSFTKEELLTPEGNINALFKILKTDRKKEDSAFRSITDMNEATRYMMTNILRPRDQSQGAQQKRISNLTRANDLLSKSVELSDTIRRSSYDSGSVIVNNNSTTSNPIASQQNPSPNAFNLDVVEMFFNQQVRGYANG